jgi:hypothetical protein
VKDGPRSVLRLCYLRTIFALGAIFSLLLAALFFFAAFSVSALATAARNAFVSTLERLAASATGPSSLLADAFPAEPMSMASKIRTASAAPSAFLDGGRACWQLVSISGLTQDPSSVCSSNETSFPVR